MSLLYPATGIIYTTNYSELGKEKDVFILEDVADYIFPDVLMQLLQHTIKRPGLML